MLNLSAASVGYPTHLHLLRLENGWPLYALTEEVGLTPDPDDCRDFGPIIPIQHDSTPIFLTLHLDGQWVPAGNATLQQVLDFRREGMAMLLRPGSASYPLPAVEPLPPGVTVPELAFYIHDHLGNTRVIYANELIECNEDSTKYIIEHALDYFPYGRTLRHYTWKRDRFQTTHHERDLESGLDYRGARFYDSDVPGFLSVDPLSADFAEWSTYNYTFGNPVRFVDPDGRSADDHIYLNKQGEEIARIEMNGPDRYFAEVESCDVSGNSCSDYIEVNSPETVKGDLKERNPWNGNIVDLNEDNLRSLVSNRTEAMEKEVLESVGTNAMTRASGSLLLERTAMKIIEGSQEGGAIDFVHEFENGTIYEINGVHYNSHEGLNYLWGASLGELGIPQNVAVSAAKRYHKSAYKRDVKNGENNKYVRVGPNNEPNHNKAIMAGYGLFK